MNNPAHSKAVLNCSGNTNRAMPSHAELSRTTQWKSAIRQIKKVCVCKDDFFFFTRTFDFLPQNGCLLVVYGLTGQGIDPNLSNFTQKLLLITAKSQDLPTFCRMLHHLHTQTNQHVSIVYASKATINLTEKSEIPLPCL